MTNSNERRLLLHRSATWSESSASISRQALHRSQGSHTFPDTSMGQEGGGGVDLIKADLGSTPKSAEAVNQVILRPPKAAFGFGRSQRDQPP